MSTTRVSGFTIKPLAVAESEKEKNKQLKEWTASFEESAAFGYWQAIDDFLTAFETDEVKACQDENNVHLKSLLKAYEKVQVAGSGVISLLEASENKEQQCTNESFAKQQWAAHFGVPPDERKWEEAVSKMNQEREQYELCAMTDGIESGEEKLEKNKIYLKPSKDGLYYKVLGMAEVEKIEKESGVDFNEYSTVEKLAGQKDDIVRCLAAFGQITREKPQLDIFTSVLGAGQQSGTTDYKLVSFIVNNLINRTSAIFLLSLENGQLLPKELQERAQVDNKPIILKRGDKLSIYGFKGSDENGQWQETELESLPEKTKAVLLQAITNKPQTKRIGHFKETIPNLVQELSPGHNPSVKARCKQKMDIDKYFGIQLEEEPNLPKFLRNLIAGLRHKKVEEIQQALVGVRRHQTETFLKDIYRNGILLKNDQGEVTHYKFNDNSDGRGKSFAVVEKFLTAKGLSKDQINYIGSSFNQAGWFGVMLNQLWPALGGNDKVLPGSACYLMITQDKGHQPVKATAQCPFYENTGSGLGEGALISAVSIDYQLSGERKSEKQLAKKGDSPDENLLPVPGRLKEEQQKVTIGYQAVTDKGYLGIPRGFGTSFLPVSQQDRVASRRRNIAIALLVTLIIGVGIATGGIGLVVAGGVASIAGGVTAVVLGGVGGGFSAGGLRYLWNRRKADQVAANTKKGKIVEALSVPAQDDRIKVIELNRNGQVVEFSAAQLKEILKIMGYQLTEKEKTLDVKNLALIVKKELEKIDLEKFKEENSNKEWVKDIISVYGIEKQVPVSRRKQVSVSGLSIFSGTKPEALPPVELSSTLAVTGEDKRKKEKGP